GTRPAVSSSTISRTSFLSSRLREVNSPVEPHGTSPSIPPLMLRSTSALSTFSSTTSPSLVKGVRSALSTPRSSDMVDNLQGGTSRCQGDCHPDPTSPEASLIRRFLHIRPGQSGGRPWLP